MHRELSHADAAFGPDRRAGLYLLTGVVGLLVAADVLPLAADRVVVKPGGRLPADGVVVAGRSAVDEGALTGESMPADKGPRDSVLAGSVNQFGALTVEATRVGERTVAGRMVELTARALRDKA